MKDVAAEQGYGYVDLFNLLVPAENGSAGATVGNSTNAASLGAKPRATPASNPGPHLTSDEMHLNPLGYFHFAEAVETSLLGKQPWLVAIDAVGKQVQATGAKAADLSIDAGKIRLTVTDDSLPLPPPLVSVATGAQTNTGARARYRFSRDCCKFKNLPAGSYPADD